MVKNHIVVYGPRGLNKEGSGILGFLSKESKRVKRRKKGGSRNKKGGFFDISALKNVGVTLLSALKRKKKRGKKGGFFLPFSLNPLMDAYNKKKKEITKPYRKIKKEWDTW